MYILIICLAIIGIVSIIGTIRKRKQHHYNHCYKRNLHMDFAIGPVISKYTGGENKIMLILTNAQKCLLSLTVTDQYGNPTSIEGVPSWIVSDPNILTLDVQPDGLTAWIVTVGPIGGCQVSVSADADLGEGSRLITGVLEVDVRPSEAVALNIAAGVPESK